MSNPPHESAPQTSPLLLSGALGAANGEDMIAELMPRIEARLDESTQHSDDFVRETLQHLLKAGGKRARPMLVILAAQLGNARAEAVVEAAAVVELTHLATLYHDDVMDEAPRRRGASAAHVVWSNSVAILAGDMLFARASTLVSALGGEALRLQASTFERLVRGQMRELRGPDAGQDRVAHYLDVLADKTGSLIAAAGEYGVLCSGADRRHLQTLRDFGERVGVAFQLADDIIDLTSDGSISGKTPGTDLREGVPTLPVLYLDRAAAAGDAGALAVQQLLRGDLSGEAELERARMALAEHEVTRTAEREARRWAEGAVAALDSLPEGAARTGLMSFAESVVARTS